MTLARAAAFALGTLLGLASTPALAAEEVAAVLPQLMPSGGAAMTQGMEASTETAEGPGLAARLLSRTDLNWTGQFNGTSLGKPLGTNYNPYQNNYGPLYLWHAVDLIHHVSPDSNVAVEATAKQDVGAARPGRDNWIVEPQFTLNDPQVWYRHNRLVNLDQVSMDGMLSIWPGVTDYSRKEDYMLFSAAVDNTFRIKLPDYRWNAQLNTRVRPTFYSLGASNPYWKHERLFLSAGHYLGYWFSDRFELAHSTSFDCNYYKDGSGSFIRGDAYDDRTTLQLNYYMPRRLGRVGVYAQSMIVDPSLDTATVGFDVTINFLTHQ